jgi:hypothetical protein
MAGISGRRESKSAIRGRLPGVSGGAEGNGKYTHELIDETKTTYTGVQRRLKRFQRELMMKVPPVPASS